MTYIITASCLDAKELDCVAACPVDCIYYEEEQDRMLYIDPETCINCGMCEPACPVGAILPEYDVPEDLLPFIQINRLYFKDKAAARSEINRLYPAKKD
jgi:NAD-dependent dihydropyrimidine dehydrogenase PreA subunit